MDCEPKYDAFRFNVDPFIVDHSVEVKILLVGTGVNEVNIPDFLASIEYVSETVNLLSPFTSNL